MAPTPFFISARLMDGTRTGLMGSAAIPRLPWNATLFNGGRLTTAVDLAHRLGGGRGEPVQCGEFVAAVRVDSADVPDADLPSRTDEQRLDNENRSTDLGDATAPARVSARKWRRAGAVGGEQRAGLAVAARPYRPGQDAGGGTLRRDSAIAAGCAGRYSSPRHCRAAGNPKSR